MKSAYLLCLGLAMGGTCAAGDQIAAPESRLTVTGFGTLGLARADDDAIRFVRDLSQPTGVGKSWTGRIDSLVGLQANYRFDDEWEGVVQAVSRYRHDRSHDPELTWAFLRHDPTPALSVRAGRLGTEFYMLADSRLVGYSNLTARPPADYFGTLIFSYIDGVDASATLPAGAGLLRGKLFAGRSPETTPFMADIPWDLSGTRLVGGHVDYITGPWQLRAGQTRVRWHGNAPLESLVGFDIIAAEPELTIARTSTRFDSLGAVYDDGPLQLQLMLSRTEHDSLAYEDSRAGFIIAAYRLGDVTPYLGYSWSKSRQDSFATPSPEPLRGLINSLTAGSHSDQYTWTLGARWDVARNLALKAQADWIHAAPSSRFLYRDVAAYPWNGRLGVLSLALDFVF
jgi:hypothetical protein